MNPNNILKLISSLVESDAGFESDGSKLDVLNGRNVSEREKTLADLVSHIYRIVHPLFSECKHLDWEEETNKEIDLLDPTCPECGGYKKAGEHLFGCVAVE